MFPEKGPFVPHGGSAQTGKVQGSGGLDQAGGTARRGSRCLFSKVAVGVQFSPHRLDRLHPHDRTIFGKVQTGSHFIRLRQMDDRGRRKEPGGDSGQNPFFPDD